MKIKDVIVEAPLDDVGDIAQLNINNVNKGREIGSKLFSPTQWFKSKTVDVPDETGTTTKVAATSAPKKQSQKTQPQQIRFALQKAAKGEQLFNDDVAYLKAAYSKVERGSAEAEALKAAIKIQPLDKQQQAALINLSKQY